MNRDLQTINIQDLLPSSIAGDETIQAAATAINDDLNQISNETRLILILARIDELEEPLLTHLAYQLRVEFWDDDLTVEEKRNLIRDSIAWHKIKGTPAAIEKISKMVFGNAELNEWFEYGGEQYKFKVKTSEVITDLSQYDKLDRLVEIAKNERSFFEAVTVTSSNEGDLFAGGIIRQAHKITILPYSHHSVGQTDNRFGGVVRITQKIKVLPYAFNMSNQDSNVYAGAIIRIVLKIKIGAENV
ncbi:MAG: phage tail protein I [Desulfobacteraceae bacterium]|nr:phage tail protein I [Desulfobacteraceae bacterium]